MHLLGDGRGGDMEDFWAFDPSNRKDCRRIPCVYVCVCARVLLDTWFRDAHWTTRRRHAVGSWAHEPGVQRESFIRHQLGCHIELSTCPRRRRCVGREAALLQHLQRPGGWKALVNNDGQAQVVWEMRLAWPGGREPRAVLGRGVT